MADFRIWGRIEHVGPAEFTVIATAVPENGDPADVRTLTEVHTALEAAQGALKELVTKVGNSVRRDGGRITNVETDGALLCATLCATVGDKQPADC